MLALTHCDSAQIAEKLGKAAEYAVCGSQWDRSLAYKDKWFGSAEDYATSFQKASTTSRRTRPPNRPPRC